MAPPNDSLNALRLMEALDRAPEATQRDLSRRAGISLGLTNLLLDRMVRKAWVKLTSVPGRRMIYALTPRGIAEKARRTRDWVRHTYRYFSETRRFLLGELRTPRPRVVCYGAHEMVELVRDAVRERGGRIVAVIDEAGGEICGLKALPPSALETLEYDHLVLLKPSRRRVGKAIDLT